jgi:GNAT superfamily N-acetyltransferase
MTGLVARVFLWCPIGMPQNNSPAEKIVSTKNVRFKSSKMEIRIAGLLDLPQLVELFELYRIFYKREPDRKKAEEFLRARIKGQDSTIYVAVAEERLLGFMQLYPQFSSTRMKKSWLLNDLFVLPEFRGRGISKELIGRAFQLAKDTDAAGVLLETEATNSIGNHLYPSMGFSRCEKNNFYWWENAG